MQLYLNLTDEAGRFWTPALDVLQIGP